MKKLLFTLLLLFACSPQPSGPKELEARQGHEGLMCLQITETDRSYRAQDFVKIVRPFNEYFDKQIFSIYPNCNFMQGKIVPLTFVKEWTTKQDCRHHNANGCVRRFTRNGKKFFIDVLIIETAQDETIRHELAHLVGCKHGDTAKPCKM